MIVLSPEPDTILVPSLLKLTERMIPLWALAFSVFSSSVAAWEGRRRQFRQKKGDLRPKTHPNPRL